MISIPYDGGDAGVIGVVVEAAEFFTFTLPPVAAGTPEGVSSDPSPLPLLLLFPPPGLGVLPLLMLCLEVEEEEAWWWAWFLRRTFPVRGISWS